MSKPAKQPSSKWYQTKKFSFILPFTYIFLCLIVGWMAFVTLWLLSLLPHPPDLLISVTMIVLTLTQPLRIFGDVFQIEQLLYQYIGQSSQFTESSLYFGLQLTVESLIYGFLAFPLLFFIGTRFDRQAKEIHLSQVGMTPKKKVSHSSVPFGITLPAIYLLLVFLLILWRNSPYAITQCEPSIFVGCPSWPELILFILAIPASSIPMYLESFRYTKPISELLYRFAGQFTESQGEKDFVVMFILTAVIFGLVGILIDIHKKYYKYNPIAKIDNT